MFNIFKKKQKPIDVVNRIFPKLNEIIGLVNSAENISTDVLDKRVIFEAGIFVASVVTYKIMMFKKTNAQKFADEFNNIWLKSLAENKSEFDFIWPRFVDRLPVYHELLNKYYEETSLDCKPIHRVALLRELLANCTGKLRGEESFGMDMFTGMKLTSIVVNIINDTYE